MLIKKSHILILFVVLVFNSCRKEESTFDREAELDKDTATMVFKTTYVSHNLEDLTVKIELVTFNKTESKENYSGLSFTPHVLSSQYSFNFSGSNSKTYIPVNSYNTAIVLDLSHRNIYDDHELGIYLRRYFEIAGSLPNRNVALSSIEPLGNHETRFHHEQAGSVFGNSWAYNTKIMYDLTNKQTMTGSALPMLFFKDRITDIIDTMVAEIGVSAEKSLVLVMSSGGFSGENEADMNEIIDKANTNNVRLNIIMEYSDANYQRLAMETGGFLSYVAGELDANGPNDNPLLKSPLKSAVLNLDALLTSDVTVHEVTLTVSKPSLDFWINGEIASINYIYNQKRRTALLRVP